MEEAFNDILVFRTNIRTEADRQLVSPLLDNHACIRQWNVDMQDIDCVLRIVSPTLTAQEAIALVTRHGYECSELI